VRTRLLVLSAATAAASFAMPLASAAADTGGQSPAQVTFSVSYAGDPVPYRTTGQLDVHLAGATSSDPTPAGTVNAFMAVGGLSHAIILVATVHVDAGTADFPLPVQAARAGVTPLSVGFVPDDPAAFDPPPAVGVEVPVAEQPTLAAVTAPAQLRRTLDSGPVTGQLLGALDQLPVRGVAVVLQQQSTDTAGAWKTLASGVTDANGRLAATVAPWATTHYRLVYAGSAGTFSPVTGGAATTTTVAPGAVVRYPAGVPQPHSTLAPLARADAPTAHAVVTPIPDSVWNSMVGVSWTPGCPVGRAQLAYIRVNYYGFDGNRYRGELVVSRKYATAIAAIFTRLHDARFPIRSMRRPDVFGKSAGGLPGANDYASMAADNTYAFNCRYVVGKEKQKVRSPHSWGFAVDLNTWENPDRSATGTFPDSWFASHRTAYAGVITATGTVRALFAHYGLGWGGTFGDFQHFDPTIPR
jgi:D-alanyl-D-alanine carboxypeptidase